MRRKVVRLTFPPPSKLHIKAPFTRSIFNASSLCFLHRLRWSQKMYLTLIETLSLCGHQFSNPMHLYGQGAELSTKTHNKIDRVKVS